MQENEKLSLTAGIIVQMDLDLFRVSVQAAPPQKNTKPGSHRRKRLHEACGQGRRLGEVLRIPIMMLLSELCERSALGQRTYDCIRDTWKLKVSNKVTPYW